MSYGLLSALSWGVATLLAAVAARRIGALRTVVLGEVVGLAGYLAMYRGLESGHVGLVSAISACYGGVIAVLSVMLLREHLTVEATVGIAATVVGVMLAVTQRRTVPQTAEALQTPETPQTP